MKGFLIGIYLINKIWFAGSGYGLFKKLGAVLVAEGL